MNNKKNPQQNKLNKVLFIIVVVTLVLRLGFVAFYPQPLIHGDDVDYDKMGKNFPEWLSSKESLIGASKPPIYPLSIFLTYKIMGYNHNYVYWLQAILNTLNGILVYIIGCRIFQSRIPSLIGLVLFAIYPSFIWQSGILYPEILFTFLLTLAVLITIISLEGERLLLFFLGGIFWGIATLCRPVIYMFIFLFSLLIFFLYKDELIKSIKLCSLFWLGFLLSLSPWIIRNYIVAGELVPINNSKGFYILYANSKIETDDYLGNPSYKIMDRYASGVSKKIGGSKWDSPVAQDKALFAKALSLIKAHPFRYIEMSFVRFVRLWFNVGYGYRPSFLAYLVMAGQIFFFILFLSWLVFFQDNRKRGMWLIVLLILYFTAVHTLTHAVYRFIIPVMPFVFLFDAEVIFSIGKRFLTKKDNFCVNGVTNDKRADSFLF